jgi:hypothetical protein
LLVKEYIPKSVIVTPWGTYAYVFMPFGLKNVGVTFKRDIHHDFNDFIGKFMVDYHDDLIVHSKLI